MKFPKGHLFCALALLTAVIVPFAISLADDPPTPTKILLDMREGAESRVTPTSEQVTVRRSQDPAAPGLEVTVAPGKEGYPGVNMKPEAGMWDLSSFGHVEAKVTNLGTKSIAFNVRIDNDGDWQNNPWNAENIYVKPGESGTVKVIFGHSYGHKPAYALKPDAIVRLLMFTGKSDVEQKYRIEYLIAAGPAGEKPPVDPNSVRVVPQAGYLLGPGVAIDPGTQLTSKNAQISLFGGGQPQLRVTFPAGKGEQTASYKLPQGRWDLRQWLEVRVQLANEGQTPVTPRLRLNSNGGPSDWVSSDPIGPGTARELVIPFAAAKPAVLGEKETGNKLTNDAVAALIISVENAEAERTLTVKSVRATLPEQMLPEWLGKRPPVEGDWIQTFNDDFNGDTLDASVWSIYGANYWDKLTHWSKDDVLVGDGVVKLRYEKKTGHQNDDPAQKESPYQAGYIHTYDKWVQRYGYFESRMKLPKAPGLWPAFWLMPDRGTPGDPQWKRQMTEQGGMEFDILEHLTRWGPNRYNIAMHYDGYGKNHKAIGTPVVYGQPDKDGYITAGLLWTPGSAIYYCNGVEVARWENERVGSVPEMMMFTLPMGGWDNNALDDSKLPDDFVIDYVRVWQRKDLASEVDGKKPASAPAASAAPAQ